MEHVLYAGVSVDVGVGVNVRTLICFYVSCDRIILSIPVT